MSEQDKTTCVICGNALDFTPRLGDWIAHEKCIDTTMVRVIEAQKRAVRVERARIGAIIEELQWDEHALWGSQHRRRRLDPDELLEAITREDESHEWSQK